MKRLPKIGTMVEVAWVDSGISRYQSHSQPEKMELVVNTTRGTLIHVNRKRIVVESETDDRIDPQRTIHGIRRNCIDKVKCYREVRKR